MADEGEVRIYVERGRWPDPPPKGMEFSWEEVRRHLIGRLQCSDVSRFLPYDADEIDEGEHGFSLLFNGGRGDLNAGIDPYNLDVCCMWEAVWFVPERFRSLTAHQDVQGEVVYGGPMEGRSHEEVLGLLFEVVCIFAGAEGIFHDETLPEWRWREHDFSEFRDCRYDVYVRNAHTGPYRRPLANITFHVNCDASEADWAGVWVNPGASSSTDTSVVHEGTNVRLRHPSPPLDPQMAAWKAGKGPWQKRARDELYWRLVDSDASRLLSYEFDLGEGDPRLHLLLNGHDGDFRVEFGSGVARVCIMGECLWVPFFGAVPQNAGGDVVWEGASGEAPEALFELVRALAGAEAVSHEVRRGRRYDVYIRNDLSGPRVTEVGNVILHVNSDVGHGRAPQPPKPPAGLGRRGLPLSRGEVVWLMERLQRSDISRFLTYDLLEEGDLRSLLLNGRLGDFRVRLSPDAVEVHVMGVRVLLASGGPCGDVARRTARGTAVYGGDADGMAHEEIIDFLYRLVCALAGATGAFCEEGHPEESAPGPGPLCRRYDVYVRNAHAVPHTRTFANITLHVNCDATGVDWVRMCSMEADGG